MDTMTPSWSIQEVARHAGTTSRTLRHYDAIGLLPPTRIGSNGYRRYDRSALVRLQRILLLRDLGLGLGSIAEILERGTAPEDALAEHLRLLREEQQRLDRRIASVERTMHALREGGDIMAETMFDGFDHTQYRAEVEQKWGADAWKRSDAWWRGLSRAEQDEFKRFVADLSREWGEAAAAGEEPAGPHAQDLAARHVRWLTTTPGTPAAENGDLAGYLRGLGELYVADDRFAANYGGTEGATLVRDALGIWVDRNLGG